MLQLSQSGFQFFYSFEKPHHKEAYCTSYAAAWCRCGRAGCYGYSGCDCCSGKGGDDGSEKQSVGNIWWVEKKYKTKSYHANKRETQMIQIKTTHTLLKFNFNKLKISGTKLTVPNTSCHFFFHLFCYASTQSKNLEQCSKTNGLTVMLSVKFKMTGIYLFTVSFNSLDMH